MNRISKLLVICSLSGIASLFAGCGGGGNSGGGGGNNQNPTTPTVTVTPASNSVTTTQSLAVTITVTGAGGTPTGAVVLSSGGYTSSSTTLVAGSATITIPSGSLTAGNETLTAKYTPDAASTATFNSASGTAAVTVTLPLITPTVGVAPATGSIASTQSLVVNIAVTAPVADGGGTPTGSVVLTSGSFTSSAATLQLLGLVSITIPAGSLAIGTDTLTVNYTPDAASSSIYASASGTGSVTVTQAAVTAVTVNINTLANRHTISPFVYGGNFNDATTVSDLGATLGRWGGNASSTYNWLLHTYNADNDYYFEDYNYDGGAPDGVSTQFITDVEAAGGHPLTTMAMLDWVAQSAENGSNGHWSFSVKTFGPQCSVDQFNTDAGNGEVAGGTPASCNTSVPVTNVAQTEAYYPLVDTASDCPGGTTDGTTCIDRQTWAQALAAAFGNGTCTVPYSTITSCHFYDMDNEVDIWGGTHRDVHPAGSGYDELANVFATEAAGLKTWDPAAVRFGPVSCCWYFYWHDATNGTNTATHGGVDFLPWWLNQIKWMDTINGARTLDVFDIHAYAEANTNGLTNAQLQAASASVYRDYWDPTYVSTASDINQIYTTTVEPNYTIPFRIPRMKALVNAIYPGTPLSFTEWSAAFYKEADFSTALGDSEAYGIFGREGLTFGARWSAPVPANPNYQALKMYTNYDGAHHGFGTVSISDLNTGNPNLFSSYAALNSTGTAMTIMVLNEDPVNTVQVTFNLNGFSPTTYTAYSISSTSAASIAASSSTAWNGTQSFAPYSITLLVVNGSEAATPASEWYLNPDDLMISANGIGNLTPVITSGTANVTLTSAVFDAYEGVAACTGILGLANATITPSLPATITVKPGSTPGFCHFTVTGNDGTATETQGGWIVVGNPPATLVQGGNNQSANAGTALPQPLTVTLSPGQSGGTANGAGFLFTTSAGSLSNGTTSGTSVIATTNGSGVASVTLTLPAAKGPVTVTAQSEFALGGATVTFSSAAN